MANLRLDFTKTYHHSTYDAISPTRPELSTAGKVVFITGGGQGIGKAIAHNFAVAGSRAIILLGRTEHTLASTRKEIESRFPTVNVSYFVVDITATHLFFQTFAAIKEEFGNIDILVNNAGYFPDLERAAKADLNEWWKGYEINVKGPFALVQTFLEQASPDAKLINVSSCVVHIENFPGHSSYASSKMAFLRTLDFFQSENPHIHMVSYHPGVIASAMNSKAGVPPQDDGK